MEVVVMSATLAVPVPAQGDPRWAALATQGTTRPVKLLALKFMLTRMAQDARRDSSPAAVAARVDELHGFFVKNPRMVEADAAALFG
jgi:hypothetical protein